MGRILWLMLFLFLAFLVNGFFNSFGRVFDFFLGFVEYAIAFLLIGFVVALLNTLYNKFLDFIGFVNYKIFGEDPDDPQEISESLPKEPQTSSSNHLGFFKRLAIFAGFGYLVHASIHHSEENKEKHHPGPIDPNHANWDQEPPNDYVHSDFDSSDDYASDDFDSNDSDHDF